MLGEADPETRSSQPWSVSTSVEHLIRALLLLLLLTRCRDLNTTISVRVSLETCDTNPPVLYDDWIGPIPAIPCPVLNWGL